MTGHSCPTWEWEWRRGWVQQCPACGTWWIHRPASLTSSGGTHPAFAYEVWWARRRRRVA